MDITVYNGTNPNGKNITVIGGVHGNEITPVYTLMQIVRDSKFSDLEVFNKINKLTIINGVNDIGLKNNERDYKKPHTFDLNRTFKDDDIDVVGELKTHLMTTDILIDVHSSYYCSEFVLIDYNQKTDFYASVCNSIGVNFGVRYSNGNTLKKFIQDRGGLSITLEIDMMEKINRASAVRAIDIIKKLLVELVNSVIDNKVYITKPIGEPIYQYYCYESGLVDYAVSPGDIIEKDDLLANILDLKGNVIEEIRARFKAKVLLVGRDYANTADSICIVQDEESWMD